MGEIIVRITVPEEWDGNMLRAIERKLVVEVARELQGGCYAKTNFVITLERSRAG